MPGAVRGAECREAAAGGGGGPFAFFLFFFLFFLGGGGIGDGDDGGGGGARRREGPGKRDAPGVNDGKREFRTERKGKRVCNTRKNLIQL